MMMMMTDDDDQFTPFQWEKLYFQRDFIGGGLAGSLGIFIGYPFDLVKLRMQKEPQLSSASQCFQKIMHDEGLKGLFRGCLPPILAQGLIHALIFFGESFATRTLEPVKQAGYLSSTATQCIAGSFGGLLSCSILVPTEVIKCGMQATKSSARNSSLWMDTTGEVKKLYRTEGIRGFFKGFTVTACRQIPSLAIYFYVYKKLRALLVSTTYMSDDIAIALSGGFAGCASWTTTYPLDVIKTHTQLSSLSSSSSFPSQTNIVASIGTGGAYREGFQPPRKSIFQVAVALHRKHGFSVFYRGIGVCVLRAFPVNCVTFSVYELFKRHTGG